MKLIILAVAALVAIVIAAPADQKPITTILRSDYQQQPEGGYNYAVETDDGTKIEGTGELKSIPDEENKPQNVIVARGSYSFVDPDGKPHSVVYYADETGYHAESEDIPKAQ